MCVEVMFDTAAVELMFCVYDVTRPSDGAEVTSSVVSALTPFFTSLNNTLSSRHHSKQRLGFVHPSSSSVHYTGWPNKYHTF